MKVFTQDPSAKIKRTVYWDGWLPTGDTIISHTVVPESGITVFSTSATGTSVTALIGGGTLNNEYDVVYHIVTSGGEEDERTIIVRVENS